MPDTGAANSMQHAGIPREKPEEDKDRLLQPSPLGSLGAAITPLPQQPRRQPEEEKPEKEAALQRSCRGSAAMRQAEMDEDETEAVQAKSNASMAESFEAGEEIEAQLNRSKGGGSPLPEPVRAFLEPRFGMDFGQVRAHIGADAVQMNREVGARAFTHGADIYYGAGHSPEDLALTAHELTHVVQQTGGAPLQAARKAEAEQVIPSPGPSLQRACSACEAEKKEKNLSGSGMLKRAAISPMEAAIQRDKIEHRALTWEDFKGKAPKSSKYDAVTYSFFEEPDLKVLMRQRRGGYR